MQFTKIASIVMILAAAGVALFTPYGLGHPTSDSMDPTLTTNDLYVIGPATTVETGDIIIFEQPVSGKITVHRVVGKTSAGYLTKGDANEVVDQEVGIQPVTGDDIRGKIPVIAGHLLIIRNGFTTFGFLINNWFISVILGVIVLLVPSSLNKLKKTPQNRDPSRPIETSDLGKIVPVLLIVATAAFIYITPSVYTGGVVATTGPIAETNRVNVPVGEPSEFTITLAAEGNRRFVTPVAKVSGGRLQTTTWHDGNVTLTMAVGPYAEKGRKEITISFYRYPASLPSSWLHTLHNVHPFIAALVSMTIIVCPLGVFYYFMIPHAPIRLTHIQKKLDRYRFL